MVRIGTFQKTENRKVGATNQNQATDKWTNDEGYDVMVRKNKNNYTLLVNDPRGNVYGGKDEERFQGSAETVNRMRGEAADVMRAIAADEFDHVMEEEPEVEDDGDAEAEEAEAVEA